MFDAMHPAPQFATHLAKLLVPIPETALRGKGMPNVTPLTLTLRVDLPKLLWLRFILPEYVRGVWAHLRGRPAVVDGDAVAARIMAKMRVYTVPGGVRVK